MNPMNTAAIQPIPAIEQVLNALCAAQPKPREKVHQFVKRCCNLLNGKTERKQLAQAICESLSELGLKATDTAADAQQVLNAAQADAEVPA